MDPIVTSGLINAGASALSTIAGSIINSGSGASNGTGTILRWQREHTEQLMDYENAINIENRDNDRAYNSPAAQVERLRAAGLNPVGRNLDGTASSTPSVSPAGSGDAAGAANAALQQKMFGLQMVQGLANVAKTFAETKNIEKDTEVKSETAEGLKVDNHYKGQVYEMNLKGSAVDIKVKLEQKRLYRKQQSAIDKQNELIGQQINESVQSVKESIQRIKESEGRVEYQEILNKLTPAKILSEIKSNNARANVDLQQVEQMRQMLPFMLGSAAVQFENQQKEGQLLTKSIELEGKKIQISQDEHDRFLIEFPQETGSKTYFSVMQHIGWFTGAIGNLLGGTFGVTKKM